VSPRRLVIGTCLIAVVAGSAGTALAGDVTRHPRNEVCVVLAQDDNGDVTKDFCVNWPGPQQL
jgi:hypothetical protein